jgi:hypothetical protein
VLESSLTTFAECPSELERFPKTQALSNRTNATVKKAKEYEPATSKNAIPPIYSPDLWKKAATENDGEPWDVASSKASVVVKAPVKAEGKSMPKQSSETAASPIRLQTKAIMQKKPKAFVRKQSTAVPNRHHSLLNDSIELTSSEKENLVEVSSAEDSMVHNDARMLMTSVTKSNISVAENILSEVDDENAVLQDYSTGMIRSESKSFTASSVAEEILKEEIVANDSTETEVMQDNLEMMLSESKRVGAISVAEEILADGILNGTGSKSFSPTSFAEGILNDDLTETEAIQNYSIEPKISNRKSFGQASVAEELLNVSESSFGASSFTEGILNDDSTEPEAMQKDSMEPKLSNRRSFGQASVEEELLNVSESKSVGPISSAEEILKDELTEPEAMQNDSMELKISNSKSFGQASTAEEIVVDALKHTEVIDDDSPEPLVAPIAPLSRSFSSQSDCERSLQKKAIAAASAHKAQREKAKVKDDRPFDESGENPNDREEVTQEAVDELTDNDTLSRISSSDVSEQSMGDLRLVSEVEVTCEPTTGETMVATKSAGAAVLWKSAGGESWTRIAPSSSQVIDEDVGMERGPRELRHTTASHKVSGSGLEKDEARQPLSLESPRTAKQNKTTPTPQSISRSPDRRQQKLQQIRNARRLLRSGLWKKPVLADRIVVQEGDVEGDGEVEIVLESDALPRKFYAHGDSKKNTTASCTYDGNTSLYRDSSWIDDFDGDSRYYGVTDEARSHVAGPGSYVWASEYYVSDSEDDSTGTDGPEEIWDEITELFKLQWRDAWQAT